MSLLMNKVLLLGIGNLLWADEGFGIRVIETLLKNYRIPENVSVLDGGTQGLYLVQYVQDADILIVFDAIDFGLTAGAIKVIYDSEVPSFLGVKKLSLHQTGFQDVLATAQMLGHYPKHLVLIGVQPVELDDYGGSLRPQVKAQIQPAIDLALQYLAQFNIEFELCENSGFEFSDSMLDMRRYEVERPSEEIACRVGDERVIYQ
jgi:hydrogenase maturation protease